METIRQIGVIDRQPVHLLAEPAGPGELDEIDLIPLVDIARILPVLAGDDVIMDAGEVAAFLQPQAQLLAEKKEES